MFNRNDKSPITVSISIDDEQVKISGSKQNFYRFLDLTSIIYKAQEKHNFWVMLFGNGDLTSITLQNKKRSAVPGELIQAISTADFRTLVEDMLRDMANQNIITQTTLNEVLITGKSTPKIPPAFKMRSGDLFGPWLFGAYEGLTSPASKQIGDNSPSGNTLS